ncbi:uncharacterized protein K441DRAFT_555677 [Cenococcum geophilum 1.58]|uniref:uncharacterized protein n=1 Tax=Cenococcum geophilum 1.58 TaxID=794803 RepID=UPI00358F4D20|nr:hypothetical protein K441DRAFT_555677 [Cenococcum geophilum 1.58]
MLTPERTEGPAGPGQAGPSDEDYNIPTSERTELLTNLKSLLEVDLVSPTFWACCQLSDIKILKGLVDTAKINPSFVLGYDTPVSVVPRLWQFSGSKKTKETYRTTNNSDGKKWVSRLDSAKDRCIERDNGECVLTKANEPQATHIFPYSMLNKTANTSHARYTAQSSFWSLLKVFWDKDRVDKWRKKIFPDPQHPDTGVDSCFNLICLTATAHGYWNNGHFALKPLKLSEDEKELTIQFFWQPQYDHKLTDNVDLLMESVSSKDLDLVEKEEKKCFLTRISDDLSTPKIKSGDIFTLTTDDPGRRPLPSLELLEMQWILQRITAMSGAAGTPEIDWSDDGDTNSRPTLIPDDNNGDIRSYSDRVYKWIPRPSLPGSVLSMA